MLANMSSTCQRPLTTDWLINSDSTAINHVCQVNCQRRVRNHPKGRWTSSMCFRCVFALCTCTWNARVNSLKTTDLTWQLLCVMWAAPHCVLMRTKSLYLGQEDGGAAAWGGGGGVFCPVFKCKGQNCDWKENKFQTIGVLLRQRGIVCMEQTKGTMTSLLWFHESLHFCPSSSFKEPTCPYTGRSVQWW